MSATTVGGNLVFVFYSFLGGNWWIHVGGCVERLRFRNDLVDSCVALIPIHMRVRASNTGGAKGTLPAQLQK